MFSPFFFRQQHANVALTEILDKVGCFSLDYAQGLKPITGSGEDYRRAKSLAVAGLFCYDFMPDPIMVFVDHSNLAAVVRRAPFYKTVSHVHYQNLIKVLARGHTVANCRVTRAKRPVWAFIYVPDEGIIDSYRKELVNGLKQIPGVFHRGGLICSDTDMCRSQVRETQTKTGWRDCATECKSISEKMIDVGIASDMVRFACRNEYETAFLVSQDRDFIPAVRAVRDEGKSVIHAFVRKSALTGVCNNFRDISSIF